MADRGDSLSVHTRSRFASIQGAEAASEARSEAESSEPSEVNKEDRERSAATAPEER
jgi:hypothetical protein